MLVKRKQRISESLLIGILLSFIGGYLDAYTYIARGGVFANAQTGNIILFGIRLAEGSLRSAAFYLLPILAFVIGVVVAEYVRVKYRENQLLHWKQIIIGIEIITLVFVAFIPQGKLDMLANIMISFVCSLQVDSFRKLNGVAYATTMCTGNLRSGTEQLFYYFIKKDKEAGKKSMRYYVIILSFILGGCIGTMLTHYFNIYSVLYSCALLIAVFVLMFIYER